MTFPQAKESCSNDDDDDDKSLPTLLSRQTTHSLYIAVPVGRRVGISAGGADGTGRLGPGS